MAEEEDRSEKLSREDGDALRNLLLYLRYVMRHKFVVIAQKTGLTKKRSLRSPVAAAEAQSLSKSRYTNMPESAGS
jgi:hypothetical protein